MAIAEVDNAMLGNIIVVGGSFLILLAPSKHFAWRPISDILKRREDRIANDLDSVEQSYINSTKMEQEREQQLLISHSDAADIIKGAKESGELSRRSILKDAQEEAARPRSKAQADITVECDSALNPVRDDVVRLPPQIAEKVLNKELSPEMHRLLINQRIEGLSSSNETR